MVSPATADLSAEALEYAAALDPGEGVNLAVRLYCYNRQPVSPFLRRRFPTPDAVASWLGVGPLAGRNWVTSPVASERWLFWETPGAASSRHFRVPFKIYVSPAFDVLPDVLPITLEALRWSPVSRLKAGGDLPGLLRPDKIVAYFRTREELDETASRLAERLNGWPAHGVPFTAGIPGAGLLSWAMDPPAEEFVPALGSRQSWRWWVAWRLAGALVTARRDHAPEPCLRAREVLRGEGVDPDSWTPPKAWLSP
jgi:hypothetical protein